MVIAFIIFPRPIYVCRISHMRGQFVQRSKDSEAALYKRSL